MSSFDWPLAWVPSRFEMRVSPNTRVFEGPYNRIVQAVDLIGEYWHAVVDVSQDNDPALAAAREAFFDRLVGPVNTVNLWHFKRPTPRGTLRDTDGGTATWVNSSAAAVTWRNSSSATVTWTYGPPRLAADVAQLSNIYPIQCVPGRTLLAGDHIGIAGQLVRVMADATANSAGLMLVEALPRARTAMPAGTAIVTTRPTARFYMRGDGVPTVHRPGMFEGASIEFEEAP